MHKLLTTFIIAIALSMDTFSVSLSIGSFNINMKKGLILSIMVGVMHFIMPLLGMVIGYNIFKFLPFDSDLVLGIIFLVLFFKMTYDYFVNDIDEIKLNIVGIFLFSLSVSMDAFTTGIGLLNYVDNMFVTLIIFMLVSFLFTISGIVLGKYANKKLGKISNIIGILILFILAIYLII